jgi:hypothetical protein
MINRKKLIHRHNPILTAINTDSPFTVGNGELAFTADITGLQTLYHEYQAFPLCTMSQWGFQTKPAISGGIYTLDDVEMTHYEMDGRKYEYAVQRQEGNEEVYDWLRHNPHRLNLARIGLLWDGREITGDEITNIRQELDLYTGVLTSDFTLNGYDCNVRTCCAKNADVLGFSIHSPAPAGRLAVRVSIPDSSHRKNASDWTEARHYLTRDIGKIKKIKIAKTLNRKSNQKLNQETDSEEFNDACYFIGLSGTEFQFTVAFSADASGIIKNDHLFDQVLSDCTSGWAFFWTKGGIADFSKCRDERAKELERRMILSQYLIAVQCAGSKPPAETGLSCNSWYGKFHLEMHIIHAGWLPLWGHGALLEKSFGWYLSILDNARANAKRNGYRGARWPKMVGPEGIDSPSLIATLLIWQQPHLLYLLELTNSVNGGNADFLKKYWLLVRETADFMADFVQLNKKTGCYDLPPPLIPAQEEHQPEAVLNPVFELCYWAYGLKIAIHWAKQLGEDYALWQEVSEKLAIPPVIGQLYPAHANCPDTFSRFNRDHPSMLYGYGFIPCDSIDPGIMLATADLVEKCWDKQSLWGWDFAFIAMTYTRLGCPEKAIEALLAETPKNSYTISGNNFQRGRDDLPLYLPGNGSLLLALAMMLMGYGEKAGISGFPRNGQWDGILAEGIAALPN